MGPALSFTEPFPCKGMETLQAAGFTFCSADAGLYRTLSLQRDGNQVSRELVLKPQKPLQNPFPAKGWKLCFCGRAQPEKFRIAFTEPFPCKGMETRDSQN